MTASGVRFLYVPAADLEAMRRFYTDILGLNESYYEPGGSLGYSSAGFQFTVLYDANAPPVRRGWATQPGWSGDTVGAVSWSVELTETEFTAAVDRLRNDSVEALHDVPVWVGYWSFPVKDPGGYTVEVTWPADDAEGREWVT